MFTTRFTLYLGILSCVPIVMSQTNITAIVGQNASLPCLVAGTYVLPGWSRDAVAINYQGFTTIHPSYAARFQIDPSDQKSLRITGVQESDEGMYQCSYSPSPAIFTGLIVNLPTTAPTTTTSPTTSPTTTSTASTSTTSPQAPPTNSPSTPRSAEEKGFTKTIMIIVIICSCGAAAIIVFIVLLVIRRWKHQKEKKSPNEMVDFEGQDVNSLN